jgi:hypothetical protein
MSPLSIPSNPLRKYLDLADALRKNKRWFEDWTIPRFSVLALITAEGGPAELVGRMRETVKRIEKRAGLFGTMNSSERHLVGAILVRDGDDPDAFSDEIARIRKLFRERKVRRGGMCEVLAIMILRTQSPHRQVSATQVTRFQTVYKALLADHYWLTGVEDFPTCALLCGSTQAPEAIRTGVEKLYQDLRARRFRRGDPLQTATHILFLTPDGPQAGMGRFEGLWRAFREAGLRMLTEDYEEVALLALLPTSAKEVVRTVLSHRGSLQELRPKLSRSHSFSLAASTAYLEMVRDRVGGQRIADVKTMIDVQHILRTRRAAAAAAAS